MGSFFFEGDPSAVWAVISWASKRYEAGFAALARPVNAALFALVSKLRWPIQL